MPKKRDYKAEYARRLARGKARGLSPSQARGHPRKGEPLASNQNRLPASSPEIEAAIKLMRQGSNLRGAAKDAGVSEGRLRKFVKLRNLATRSGRTWAIYDIRPRRVAMLSEGRQKSVIVQGYPEARKAGRAWDLQGRFSTTVDVDLLTELVGEGLIDIKGQFHPFETDPNAILRIASMDEPPFHEIYQIVS